MIASELAKDLKNAGLKEVGILKLHSCCVGQEKYLDQLKDELKKLEIKVGYLCGPTGISIDPRFYAKICGVEFIFHTLPMKLVSHKIPFLGNVIYKPEKFGLKVVQGDELKVAYKKTRYKPQR